MYTIFSNEKLGMPVEQMRLAEIRQQIEAQRLGDEMNPTQPGRRPESPREWLNRLKVSFGNARWHKKQTAV